MPLATILTEVRAILLTVPGMSPKVYTYEPWAAQASAVRALFTAGPLLHAWTLTRESSTEQRLATGHENVVIHTLRVRGYYSLGASGETATTFQTLIEAILTTFRLLPALNGAAETSGPLQVELVEPRMFCEVLCHYAELRLDVQELVTW